MRYALFVVCLLVGNQAAQADFIWQVTQRTPGDIRLGDSAIFDISIRTGGGTGTVTNFGGATFFLGADDPTPDGNQTTGGTFAEGTSDNGTALAGGRSYLFSGESFVAPAGSFAVFSGSGANRNLGNSGGLLASLVLNTQGATVGTHTLTFTNLDAIDAGGNTLVGPFIGEGFSYTISVNAVPEPGTLLLSGGALGVIALGALRRKRRTPKAVEPS